MVIRNEYSDGLLESSESTGIEFGNGTQWTCWGCRRANRKSKDEVGKRCATITVKERNTKGDESLISVVTEFLLEGIARSFQDSSAGVEGRIRVQCGKR